MGKRKCKSIVKKNKKIIPMESIAVVLTMSVTSNRQTGRRQTGRSMLKDKNILLITSHAVYHHVYCMPVHYRSIEYVH